MNSLMKVGVMVWRIGEILDFYRQIQWSKTNAFHAIEFWTLPGQPGAWQGFDAENASKADVAQLKEGLAGFETVSLHAGFNEDGSSIGHSAQPTVNMEATFELAAAIGADVITVHPQPKTDEASSAESVYRLNELAERYGVWVGVETMGGLESQRRMQQIQQLAHPRVGITIDTGHVHFENGATFSGYGSVGKLIEAFGSKIVHFHLHDYDGQHDHIAVGRGRIDFPGLIGALYQVGFSGSMTLELNPGREPPHAILTSRDRLLEMISQAREAGSKT